MSSISEDLRDLASLLSRFAVPSLTVYLDKYEIKTLMNEFGGFMEINYPFMDEAQNGFSLDDKCPSPMPVYKTGTLRVRLRLTKDERSYPNAP